MPQIDTDVQAKLRRLAFVPIFAGLLVIVGFWCVYFMAAVMNVDVLHHNQPPDRTALQVYLLVCAAATLLGVPVAYLAVRERLYLAGHGMQTNATVVNVSAASRNGIRPVTYQYDVGGKAYKVKRDTPQICVDCFNESTRVRVVYDPSRPSRCHVFATDVLSK
jgi:hypothetical protein